MISATVITTGFWALAILVIVVSSSCSYAFVKANGANYNRSVSEIGDQYQQSVRDLNQKYQGSIRELKENYEAQLDALAREDIKKRNRAYAEHNIQAAINTIESLHGKAAMGLHINVDEDDLELLRWSQRTTTEMFVTRIDPNPLKANQFWINGNQFVSVEGEKVTLNLIPLEELA